MSTSQVFKDASKPFVQTKVNLILPPYLSIHSLNKYLCSTCSMPGKAEMAQDSYSVLKDLVS